VPRRDAEPEDVADLGVDGILALRGAGGDYGLDAAADEPGDLTSAATAGCCCLRNLSDSNMRFGQQRVH
jgi:hypothetical protein